MSVFTWTPWAALALIWAMAAFQASIRTWTLGIGIILTALSWPVFPPGDGHLLLAGVYVVLALVFNSPTLRIRLITGPIMRLFKKALPPLSKTEQEALEAGTVWWDRELFSGRPQWRKLLDQPSPALTPAEQAFVDGPVETLCHLLNDWEITAERKDLPPEVWTYLKRERFFGMVIPREYGGLGFSARAHSAVVAKIAGRSVTAAVTVMVPNSLGPAELLRHYGTDAQRDHYLPRLADGREIPCFALTSPEAGSDAGAMPDRGKVCRQDFQGRKNVLGARINWNKRYITLGPVATLLGLAFRLEDPDGLLPGGLETGITLALIPTNTPGVLIGNRHNPLDIPFQNGPTRGRDVFIPLEWIIGGPARAGQGWRMLMDCLSEGRAISLPALSAGAAKTASRVVGNYARVRKQFGLPIGRFQGIETVLGRMAGQTYLMEAARRLTAGAVDQGEKPSVISALTKYQMTERMRLVVNDAMDVVGGAGISLGPSNLLGRMYQSIPVGITVEGANILTRTLIVFGQGAVRAHPFLLRELKALDETDPGKRARDFDAAFLGHVGFAVGNVARTLWLGLTGGRPHSAPVSGPEGRYYRQLGHLSSRFAMVADVALLTLGGSLKRREALSGRMADMLSHLYLGSAVLKRFHDEGRPRADEPLLAWAMAHHLHGAQESLHQFLVNFPHRPVAWLLRLLCFPLGRHLAPPDDRLTATVARRLLEPSADRDRLTAGIFIPGDADEPLARLESAARLAVLTEPLEKRLKVFRRVAHLPKDVDPVPAALEAHAITEVEARTLARARTLANQVIQVDDFDDHPPHQQERAA